MEEKKEPTVGDSAETTNESPSPFDVPDSQPETGRATKASADASEGTGMEESAPEEVLMSEDTESNVQKDSTPEPQKMPAFASAVESARERVWDWVTRSLQRVPLVNRIPFERIGPQKTTIGILVVAFALVGSLSAFTYDGTTVAKKAPRTGVTQPHQQPKPKPIPFTVMHEGRQWTVDLRTLGYDGKDPSTLNRDQWLNWFRRVKKEVDEPAMNAEQHWFGGKITPSKTGKFVIMDTIEKEWLPRLTTMIGQSQELPMVLDQPEVTEADFQQVDQRLIGKYTTYFDGSNVNRTTNIRLAAKAINNLILSPGERFSFNRVVGPSTPERGYKLAKVIVRGEYTIGFGGGICQVSSTLYNSVDEAGLKILQRNSHSKEVAYVPPGRDATVSWGGPDFRFKNNLTKPILIRVRVTDHSITTYVFTTPDAG